MRLFVSLSLCLIICVSAAFAGLDPSYSTKAVIDTVPFYAGGTYDQSVPEPNEFLARSLGQWPLRYHELEDWLLALAESTDRVRLEVLDTTYEGRNLYNVFISSKQNMANLDGWREANAQLAAADNSAPIDPAQPAFAWLGYSIHGDEISGVDAATRLIYQLAAGTDDKTVRLLADVVAIICPSQNPDGRERYLSMLQTYKSAVPNYNRHAMQHNGVWPWGRGNHYLFDLNRDWILLRQQETKSKLASILKWNPQLIVDGHEMGSNASFLFSPPRQPINYNTPDFYLKWADILAADQAAAFDQRGWAYYTGEWHEQWYPGYGSAWGTFFGAISVLYEMAGVDGQFVKQQDDYLLTYHEAVNKQFTSSLANLSSLSRNRAEILAGYRDTRLQILEKGRASKLSFLFRPDSDELRMKRFVESLTGQGIEVLRATEDFTLSSATDTHSKKASSVRFPMGTYIVSTAQVSGGLAKAVLEFDPRLNYEFLKEERRELEKHGDTRMYEVSTWTPSLAYGIDAWWTTSTVGVATEQVSEVTLSGGVLHNAQAEFAFIAPMVGEKTYELLVRLFAEDLVIRCSEKPFSIDGRDYAAGSLVMLKRGNQKNLGEILSVLAEEVGLDVWGVNTGFSSAGSLLGAGTFRLLRKPSIGLLVGNGIGSTSLAGYWYVLDQELRVPHSLVSLDWLRNTNLDGYNVLIVPGSWGSFGSRVGKAGKEKIKKWVRDGGTLICSGQSAVWAADTATSLSSVRLRRQILDKLDSYTLGLRREQQAEAPQVDTMALWYPEKVPAEEAAKEKPTKLSADEAKRVDEWQRKFSPSGVILNALLDPEDWLCFGMGKSVPVMMWSSHAFMAQSPVKTTARLADKNDLRLSGLLWPEARERWANTAYATHERSGKGQIVLFASHPNMRAYFYGSRQLLVNAILLGPGMGSSFEGPYSEQAQQ